MKKLFPFLIALTAFAAGPIILPWPPGSTGETVRLNWEYDHPGAPNITFLVHGTTNLATPMENWAVITNVPGSATNRFSVTLSVERKEQFFAVRASNFWGAGSFSAVVSTPALLTTHDLPSALTISR